MGQPTKGAFCVIKIKSLAWFNVDRDISYQEALEKALNYYAKRKDKANIRIYFHGFESDNVTPKPRVEIKV